MGYSEIYKDAGGKWRWRIVAQNGKILAVSSEAYSRRGDCRRCLNLVVFEAAAWKVIGC